MFLFRVMILGDRAAASTASRIAHGLGQACETKRLATRPSLDHACWPWRMVWVRCPRLGSDGGQCLSMTRTATGADACLAESECRRHLARHALSSPRGRWRSGSIHQASHMTLGPTHWVRGFGGRAATAHYTEAHLANDRHLVKVGTSRGSVRQAASASKADVGDGFPAQPPPQQALKEVRK